MTSAPTPDLAQLERDAAAAIADAGTVQALSEVRAGFLGKKGALTSAWTIRSVLSHWITFSAGRSGPF